MMLHRLAPLLAITVMLTACSGGGSAHNPALSTAQQGATASGTLTISLSNNAGTASRSRKPAYISPSTTQATLFIDGSTSGFRTPCTFSAGGCTINWTSTSGTHTFSAEIDDGSASGGNVLAQGSESVTLAPGLNSVPNITLNGVPAQVYLLTEAICPSADSQCTLGSTLPSYVEGTYQLLDMDGNIITSPGQLLEGGICLSGGTNATVAAVSGSNVATPACSGASPGNAQFAIACYAGSGSPTTGSVTMSASLADAPPLLSLSAAQIAAYGLQFPSSLTMPGWPATYQCSNGTIAVSGPANGSVTIQSHNG